MKSRKKIKEHLYYEHKDYILLERLEKELNTLIEDLEKKEDKK